MCPRMLFKKSASYNATVLAPSKIIVDEENFRQKSEGLQNLTEVHLDNKGYLQVQIGQRER